MSHGDMQISGVLLPDSLHVNFDLNGPHLVEGESPASSVSRYSSCAESDFDRYSSANSALGTPSLCGSVGTLHDCASDFDSWSTRSLGPMDGNLNLEGFSLDGRLSGKLDNDKGPSSSNPSEHLHGLGYNAVSSWGGLETSEVEGWSSETGKKAVVYSDGEKEDLGMLLSSVENVLKQGSISSKTMNDKIANDPLVYGDGFGRDQNLSSSLKFQEEQEVFSSMHEHSDDKDSMFDSGSDDESKRELYYSRNADHHYGKDTEKGNALLMNSSIAFGSADWEDFELQKEYDASDLLMFNKSSEKEEQSSGNYLNPVTADSSKSRGHKILHVQDPDRAAADVSETRGKFQGFSDLADYASCTSATDIESSHAGKPPFTVKESSTLLKSDDSDNDSLGHLEGCEVHNIFTKEQSSEWCNKLAAQQSAVDRELSNEISIKNDSCSEEPNYNAEKSESPSDVTLAHASSSKDIFEDLRSMTICEDRILSAPPKYESALHSGRLEVDAWPESDGLNTSEDNAFDGKGKTVELNAFYDEVVLDMEEILLESSESPVTRLNQTNKFHHSQQPSTLRDGGSTASTSGTDDNHALNYPFCTVDDIKVVGTKQKRGDISLSERLVGVKEHTVYVIRVWGGEDQWEVEHRYRDFYTLYSQLKSLFSKQGWILPSAWSAVEGESMKIFGNSSPDVVAERSALIQDCLQSAVKFKYPSNPPSALIWFLSRPKPLSGLHQSDDAINQPGIHSDSENISTMGQTISLIVEIRPHRSMKQMLEAQHYTCGGCHKQFDGGKTRVLEFVQTLGWGKPRLCEYTGQLFCTSCHTNDTAVLPARVLHYWDFTEYPVCQFAKSYLDSINDQPMLCVSAVNPFLFSRVKVLLHVVGIRRKIGALLQYVHCPFRGTVYRGLGSRRYLLDSNDFFALRDLIDLARGPFAVLPVVLETVLGRIQEHITEQCLVCCDVGVSCGARQACDDTSSLIFPFQDEEEIRRCETCNLVFHKRCFERLDECSCGAAHFKADKASPSMSSSRWSHGGSDNSLSFFGGKSDLGLKSSMGMGFLSSLFALGKQEKSMAGQEEDKNVILMGSLPGNSF